MVERENELQNRRYGLHHHPLPFVRGRVREGFNVTGMDIDNERIERAARYTEILRYPRQHLATFGVTNLFYYIVTEPVYSELTPDTVETVIREGRVIAERPKIVTPYYLTHLEGFSYDARRYFQMLLQTHGPDIPGLFYTYKNEPGNLNIVSDGWQPVIDGLHPISLLSFD